MNEWQKTIPSQQVVDVLLIFTILLFGLGLINDLPLVALITGFSGVFIVLLRMYNRRIGNGLTLLNEPGTIRLFSGETVHLTFHLKNHAIFPYPEGVLSFEASSHVTNDTYLNHEKGGWKDYRIPVTLAGNGQTEITVPFEASRRGVMTVRNIRLIFTHPFTFQPVILAYNKGFHTRVMIYPEMRSVYTANQEPVQYLGSQASRHALFEDLLQPIGTREALLSDSFKHIHWKASAKRQTLQTKVYQPNQHIAWTIVVNIAETSHLGNTYLSEQTEVYLSQAAYIAKQLISQGQPVELFVNSNLQTGPLHVHEGNDTQHLKKILEALALVPPTSLYPMQRILHALVNYRVHSQMLILIGHYNARDQLQIKQLHSKGHPLYQVQDAVLYPYTAQRSDIIEA